MKRFQYPHATAALLLLGIIFSSKSFAQPANNNCGGAVQLTSNTSCVKLTNQTLNSATDSASYPTGCLVGTHYDVWYYFTAAATH